MEIKNAAYWIHRLQLQEHPEGGYYAEVYRSEESISKDGLPDRFEGPRSMGTSIYFLLHGDTFSAFHRIKSDEGWHFYTGNHPVHLYVIAPDGTLTEHILGSDFEARQKFQAVVPAGHWFAARAGYAQEDYALVGCTVSPGFDFQDFEMAEREELLKQFPQHEVLIKRFTRE